MVTVKEIQEQLTKNLLVPIILDLLDDCPMCGYEIMSTIRKTFGLIPRPKYNVPNIKQLGEQ